MYEYIYIYIYIYMMSSCMQVHVLLEQEGGSTLLRVPDFLGYTALLVACRNGQLNMVKMLLEHPEGGDALLEDKDHGMYVYI